MELTTFDNRRDEVITRLGKYKIVHMPDFDPLSTDSLKDEKKYAGLSDTDKRAKALDLYKARLDRAIERLPANGINNRLRNYLSLRKDVSRLDSHGNIRSRRVEESVPQMEATLAECGVLGVESPDHRGGDSMVTDSPKETAVSVSPDMDMSLTPPTQECQVKVSRTRPDTDSSADDLTPRSPKVFLDPVSSSSELSDTQ